MSSEHSPLPDRTDTDLRSDPNTGYKWAGEQQDPENKESDVPSDFTPIPGDLPPWIDIASVCKEATRYVALHALSTFNAIAINDGRRVFTTADRGGEFRRLFRQLAGGVPQVVPDDATLVYDCESHLQWVAPKPSAMRFLSLQF